MGDASFIAVVHWSRQEEDSKLGVTYIERGGKNVAVKAKTLGYLKISLFAVYLESIYHNSINYYQTSSATKIYQNTG